MEQIVGALFREFSKDSPTTAYAQQHFGSGEDSQQQRTKAANIVSQPSLFPGSLFDHSTATTITSVNCTSKANINPSFRAAPQLQVPDESKSMMESPQHSTDEGDQKSDDGHTTSPTPASSQNPKILDTKTLRRLAQNREAARKSRLRKKAYVQQLESSRMKLNQLEQELQRARQQGFYIGGCLSDPNHPGGSSGAAAFDLEYSRWLEEQQRQMTELRASLQTHVSDEELRTLVDSVMSHYDEIFRLKSAAAKSDVFHLVSGMWKSPAERCFMWMGGFRPSELLKILIPQLEPLTEQQMMGICNLQQSSQQAEDALSQGMEALQQSLADTLASGSLGSASNVANYMGQMAMAMGKLGTLENFVKQADNLRQQTLQQMHRILTTRQAARAFLAIGDYFGRLRALSSLWAARPRD